MNARTAPPVRVRRSGPGVKTPVQQPELAEPVPIPEPLVAGGSSVDPAPGVGLLGRTPAVAPPVAAVPHGSPLALVRPVSLEFNRLPCVLRMPELVGELVELAALGLPGV